MPGVQQYPAKATLRRTQFGQKRHSDASGPTFEGVTVVSKARPLPAAMP
jgi:hypothetical protein